MHKSNASLLLVDDDAHIRALLSLILTTAGCTVRTAEDGFSALDEIRSEAPDIIVSDLNMPGMSGFEFLSVVRRRFPSIQVIAMSSAFSDRGGIPTGVAADVFYEKATNVCTLLDYVKTMVQPARYRLRVDSTPAPIWLAKQAQAAEGAYVLIGCPDCLRTFPQHFGGRPFTIHQTHCIYCRAVLRYAVVEELFAATAPAPVPVKPRYNA